MPLKLGYVIKATQNVSMGEASYKQTLQPKAQGAGAHCMHLMSKILGGVVCLEISIGAYTVLSCFTDLLRKHKACFPKSSVLATTPATSRCGRWLMLQEVSSIPGPSLEA